MQLEEKNLKALNFIPGDFGLSVACYLLRSFDLFQYGDYLRGLRL